MASFVTFLMVLLGSLVGTSMGRGVPSVPSVPKIPSPPIYCYNISPNDVSILWKCYFAGSPLIHVTVPVGSDTGAGIGVGVASPSPSPPKSPSPSKSPSPFKSPSPSGPVGPVGPKSDVRVILEDHNKYRKVHRSVPLTWNNTIAASAAAWVNKCNLTHDRSIVGRFGENLLFGKVPVAKALADASRLWYNEVKSYNFTNPEVEADSMKTNHFTQMVWRGTSSLGCAYKVCNGTTFLACRYYKPGNVRGQYKFNVLPAV